MERETDIVKFKSKKDWLFGLLTFGFNVLFLGFLALRIFGDGVHNYTFLWADVLIVAVCVFLFWLYFGTNYKLTKTALWYKSGPIQGKIEIAQIREIIVGKSMWSGLKPATARNGLIIKYDKYNEIYISPKSNIEFVERILKLNPEIKIINYS
jgi:hypothetical protein